MTQEKKQKRELLTVPKEKDRAGERRNG